MFADTHTIEQAIKVCQAHQKAWAVVHVHDKKKRDEKQIQLGEIIKTLRWANGLLKETQPTMWVSTRDA